MINLCPQRGCDACYDLGSSDVGRTFRCLKCDALLEVEQRGLKVLASSGEGPEPRAARASPSTRQENSRMSSIVREGNSGGGILGLLATCVFTFGALLVILFLFLPIIDQAYVSRQAAVIDAGERRERRLDEELRTKQRERLRDEKPDPDLKGKDDSRSKREQEENDDRKKDREKWDKRKKVLENEVEDTRTGARRADYVYSIGMLFGLLTLAVGAIAFLAPSQSTPRKVVGAIVITVQMVVIFMLYMMRGSIRGF